MAITFTATHTKTLANPSSGSGDKVYGADYVSSSSHSVGIAGLTAGRIPYPSSATALTDSANLFYDEASGPRLQVGSGSGTSQGWFMGYGGASGYSFIGTTALAAGNANAALTQDNEGSTFLNAASTKNVTIYHGGNNIKFTSYPTAGRGPDITAGTAATDVAALSLTRTNNNAAVATGVKWTFTDTTSAAGFLPFQILGGAAGTTNLLSVGKTGIITVGDILVLKGYAVASLPTGIDGAIALVTDQLTSVAAKGVAPTGGGSVHCAVIYNGSAWVGI